MRRAHPLDSVKMLGAHMYFNSNFLPFLVSLNPESRFIRISFFFVVVALFSICNNISRDFILFIFLSFFFSSFVRSQTLSFICTVTFCYRRHSHSARVHNEQWRECIVPNLDFKYLYYTFILRPTHSTHTCIYKKCSHNVSLHIMQLQEVSENT